MWLESQFLADSAGRCELRTPPIRPASRNPLGLGVVTAFAEVNHLIDGSLLSYCDGRNHIDRLLPTVPTEECGDPSPAVQSFIEPAETKLGQVIFERSEPLERICDIAQPVGRTRDIPIEQADCDTVTPCEVRRLRVTMADYAAWRERNRPVRICRWLPANSRIMNPAQQPTSRTNRLDPQLMSPCIRSGFTRNECHTLNSAAEIKGFWNRQPRTMQMIEKGMYGVCPWLLRALDDVLVDVNLAYLSHAETLAALHTHPATGLS